MEQTWQQLLESIGATLSDGEVRHFGDAAKELQAAANGNVIADLSHLGLIQVSGADALTFLQGQLTQDIAKITEQRAAYAGHCSPKGRLLGRFLVWKSNEDYFLQLPRELVAPIQKRLKMYVLRSKVALVDVSASTIRFGVAGFDAATLIAKVLGSVPTQSMDVNRTSLGTIIALPNGRFEILVAEDASALWKQLASTAQPVGAPVWRWLRIRAGIPEIYIATQEQFVPQMVNDDLLGAVSFQKGCYTGQEIVARMHYLGKSKRRMVSAHVESNAMPQPGDTVFSSQIDGQAIGMVVDAATSPLGGFDLLISLSMDENSDSTHHLSAQDGPEININTFTIN